MRSAVWRRALLMLLMAVIGLSPFLSMAQGLRSSGQVTSSEDVLLHTKDGIKLGATYYASDRGKDAVPVVMLHNYKESRNVFDALARSLQGSRDAFAVLTVDIRGHGESVTAVDRFGNSLELDAADMRPVDFRNIVTQDMEAVRKFLVRKNETGSVSI